MNELRLNDMQGDNEGMIRHTLLPDDDKVAAFAFF